MKVVYLSNIFNHYQKSFSDEMCRILRGKDNSYYFIETTEIPEERLKLGWSKMNVPYVISAYTNDNAEHIAQELVNDADVVIYGPGSAPFKFVKKRLKDRKLTYACTERVLKKSDEFLCFFPRFVKYRYIFKSRKNAFLLCMGAYVASDFNRMGLFKDKSYRFGYFPYVEAFDEADYLNKKKHSIIWAGRMIRWKHPERAIRTASRLKDDGIEFHLDILGDGEIMNEMKSLVNELELSDYVTFQGSLSPDKVRAFMKNSEIFLLTSDRNEGWGVVVNEAMSCGCAVVADQAIGSVPYLIRHKENGYIYDGEDGLYEGLKYYLLNPEMRLIHAQNANKDINELWSPKCAAERLIQLSRELLERKDCNIYADGPCSKIRK